MNSPNICILKTDGINGDSEMANAFAANGGNPNIIHINELRGGDKRLKDNQVLVVPGGFSYGDAIASGKVLANELTSFLGDQVQEHIERSRPVLGVCNGFQVLVRASLLPGGTTGEQQATLTDNSVGHFVCRWIDLAVGKSKSKFVQPEDFEEQPLPMQMANGEGRYFGSIDYVQGQLDDQRVVFRYTTPELVRANGQFPYNPNGALFDIAGICDETGLILGMMPHPERSVSAFHPYRARTEAARHAAQVIFSNIVNYAKEL